MAIKLRASHYKCSYCDTIYSNPTKADMCRDSHDLVYVQLAREDLMRLIQFIHLKNDALLRPQLLKSLMKYTRMRMTPNEGEDYLSSLSAGDIEGTL